MHWFYSPDIKNKQYTLNEQESKHCVRVLRLKQQDKIYLVDGLGTLFTAKIIVPNPKKTAVEIIEIRKNYGKRNYKLHIAVAPTKTNERFEWFLEKATEIGIDEITPLLCEHSERKKIKHERYNKVLEAAMKQSYKAYHPKLNKLTKFSDFVKNAKEPNKIIAHCIEGNRKKLKNLIFPDTEILITIGPEGGFSPKEINIALQNNFLPATLANTRLRTETAAIVACNAVAFINQ